MSKVLQITDEKNVQDFIKEYDDKCLIVQFHATWCQPCKKLGPVLIEKAKNANVDLVQLDVDENEENSEKYEVNSIPRVLFFKKGKLVYDHVGGEIGKLDEGFKLLK